MQIQNQSRGQHVIKLKHQTRVSDINTLAPFNQFTLVMKKYFFLKKDEGFTW